MNSTTHPSRLYAMISDDEKYGELFLRDVADLLGVRPAALLAFAEKLAIGESFYFDGFRIVRGR